MRTELKLASLALLCLLLACPARAAEPRELTLTRAVSSALDSLPQLGAARQRLAAARERLSAARAAYAPTTTLRVGAVLAHDRLAQDDERTGTLPGDYSLDESGLTRSLQGSLAVDLELFDFGRRRHTVRAAEALTDVSRADVQQVRIAAVQLVVRAYLVVLRDERRLTDARLSVALQEKLVGVIRRLVERRARPEVDLQRAEVQLRAARDALSVLEARTESDRLTLALVMGVDSLEGVVLAAPSDGALAWDESESALVHGALERRPELAGADAQARALERSARANTAALAPRVTLEVTGSLAGDALRQTRSEAGTLGGRDAGARTRSELSRRSTSAAAGLFVTWQGLDPVAWARRRESQAEARAARRDAAGVRRELRTAVLVARTDVSRTQAELARVRHLREGALATLEAQRTRYELGAASLLELLDAQAVEQEARAQVIDAELAHALAQAELLGRAGTLEQRVLAPAR
jgi:outer membrane protein